MSNLAECKVVLFLESHIDALNIGKASINLLPFFAQQGFKSFCLESSKDKDSELFENRLAIMSIQKGICSGSQKTCDGLLKKSAVTIGLIDSLDDSDFQYCAIDQAHRSINMGEFASFDSNRDKHMAIKIEEQCANGHVLASVGFAHYQEIKDNLLKNGFSSANIKGYYASSEPIPTYASRMNALEIKIRSTENAYSQHESGIVMIDLFKDASLDTTSLIRTNYENHINNIVLGGEGAEIHREL